MLRSLIRILRASLVQIDTEMAEKYSNHHDNHNIYLMISHPQDFLTYQILAQNRDFCLPHLHLTPPLGGGGSRRNIATPFGVEKQEWCGYPMVKKFEDMFIRFDMIHERDRQTDRRTDRQRMPAYTALMNSIAR